MGSTPSRAPAHWLRRTIIFTALSALLSSSAVAAPAWVRIETPNFVVFGEVGEKSTREVAQQFERFREVLARILPGAASPAAVPTVVVVFRNQKSFGIYRIRYNGKPIELDGFFVGASDENLVALSMEHRDAAMRTIFHEYAHLIIGNAAGNLPVWLNEGLADYYSTLEIDSGGKSAVRGRIAPEYVRLLREVAWLRPEELMSVTHDSPLYNEGSRRSIFYAQSWAIVHLLLNGKVDRTRELARYARATAAGARSVDAWREVFPDLNLTSELNKHLTTPIYQVTTFQFASELPRVRGDTSDVPPAEIQATLGDVLRRVAPVEETEAHLRQAVATPPAAPRGKALLGQLLVERGRPDEAKPFLLDAAGAEDWLARYTAAIALTRMATEERADNRDVIAGASKALDSISMVRPDLPYALAMRAQLALAGDGDLEAALQAIRRARAQAPGREDLAFIEARVLAGRREFAQARTVLGPFMSSIYSKEVRDYAKSLMAHVLNLEKYARSLPAETSVPSPRAGQATQVPLYREPGDGETKTEGRLENIECSMRGVVLHVRVKDQVLRYAARTMNGIEFITYRTDLTGGVACASRVPPDKVFITWRPRDAQLDESFAGWVVAVEFLR